MEQKESSVIAEFILKCDSRKKKTPAISRGITRQAFEEGDSIIMHNSSSLSPKTFTVNLMLDKL